MRRVSRRLTTMSWKTLATRLLRYYVNLSLNFYIYSLQALAVRLGLTEYFPSAVHRQTRLGAILSPLVRTTTTNHSPVLSITSLYLLQVRALEIATDKSTINLKFLHPGSDPDSGHSSMTSAANSVFTSPLKKVR